MRAPRFCHVLGLEPDDTLVDLIKEQAPGLTGAAVERIVSEICMTLSVGRSADAVRLWKRLELLEVLFPELAQAAIGVEADPVPRAVARMEMLDGVLDDPASRYPEVADFLEERLREPVDGSVGRPAALRLAALTGGLGIDQVRALGRRLKLSGALASLLTAVARCSFGADAPVGQSGGALHVGGRALGAGSGHDRGGGGDGGRRPTPR